MKKSIEITVGVIVLAIAMFIIAMAPFADFRATADQAQYFYDELGPLTGVVDGTGNVAVCSYDDVGNLLAIQRVTPGATGIGIFLLAPASARVGTQVTIQGFGFSPTPANNQVQFNGTPATVVSATATSVIATAPSGATSGPVTVTNTNGTATSPQPFTVLVPPIVVGVDPGRVPQGTTVRVVIAGFNLDTATGVTFTQSGLSASILPGGTAQNLPFTLTVGTSVPAGSYPFSLTSPLGVAQSGTITVTVTPPVPSFNAAKPLSIFKPFPAQTGWLKIKGRESFHADLETPSWRDVARPKAWTTRCTRRSQEGRPRLTLARKAPSRGLRFILR